MKRKVLKFAALVLMGATLMSVGAYAEGIGIVIDGKNIETDVAPIITPEGRTIVPLRVISENLGANVEWDGTTKTVTAEKEGDVISLVIGEEYLDFNGKTLELDSPAQIVNERTMVPIRIISECFGCNVDWEAETKTVVISSAEEKKETKLPKYTANEDKYIAAAESKILEYSEYYSPADLSQPVVTIVKVDDSDPDDIKCYGSFWILNYDLKGKLLELVSGGSYPGCMHMKKGADGSIEVTSFDIVEDGENGQESLEKICGGDKELAAQVTKALELNEDVRKEGLKAYVKANKLDIEGYKDYGYDAVYFDTEGPTETSGDLIGEEVPNEFIFSSGAGGWRTVLRLNKDGSFTGNYSDSEMGSTGEGYPKGSVYVCDFSGKFTDIKKDGQNYTMKLESLESEKKEGEEWIEDEIKYIYSTPYGIEGGKNFVIYAPDTPLEGFSETFLSWWPGRYSENKDQKTLGFYSICNVETEEGFFAD